MAAAPGIRVIIAGLPLADLHAWGREPSGAWWGLVSWKSVSWNGVSWNSASSNSASSNSADHRRPVARSAWVPAACVVRPAGSAAQPRVVRLKLPVERGAWPLLWFVDGVRVEHLGAVRDPSQAGGHRRPD